jgi:arsenate reductase
MKTVFYLPNCGTCKRILSEIKPGKEVKLRDIKQDAITEEELDEMLRLAGSHEALFSRVAMKYREKDYRYYMLKDYTFLKRPTIIYDGEIFIGSSKATIERAKKAFGTK